MKAVTVCSATFLLLALLGPTHAYYDLNKIEDQLTRMEGNLEVLTNEMARMKDDIHDLKCVHSGDEKTNTGALDDNATRIVLLEARREFVPEGVQFSVRYNLHGTRPVRTTWFDEQDFFRVSGIVRVHDEKLTVESDGVRESRAIVTPRNGTRLWVIIENEEEWVRVVLQNDLEGDVVQTDIEMPTLEFEPSQDLTYRTGQDINFQITFSRLYVSKSGSSPGDHQLMKLRGTKLLYLKTGHIVPSYDLPEDFYRQSSKKKFLNTEEVEIQLQTSKYPVSGFIKFGNSIENKEGFLKTIELTRHVIVRPSAQKDAFPEDFMEFANKYYMGELQSNGTYIQSCGYGDDENDGCLFFCDVVGNRLVSLNVNKVNPDGSRDPVAFEQEGEMSNMEMKGFLMVNESSQDIKQHVYECQATNQAGYTETQQIIFNFYVSASIIKEESSLQWINTTTINATCTTSGDPQPRVFMFRGTYWANDIGSEGSLSLQDKLITWKTFEIPPNKNEFIICYMRQELPRDSKYEDYRMYVADAVPATDS